MMDDPCAIYPGFSVSDPCAICPLASDPDDIACLWCPNNPYPYEDYFETHQL